MDKNSVCRNCRREGVKLFLKGQRCSSPNCPIERKGAVAPGKKANSKRRNTRLSDYGQQLREKQHLKRVYGLEEKQFRQYFLKAKKAKSETIETFLQFLESRLDNIVYRLGFAPSRDSARQLVGHGHVLVDGKKVDISSYRVKEGATVSLSSKALKMPQILETMNKQEGIPGWLERKAAVGRVKKLPIREEVDTGVDEQAVVEFYSK
ncbi:MAG: 30S ribosomal protein S4 [Candidatus Curtissbacteria bacterium]|nr:30S ribosomal protein S4 [bacterium]MDZ4209834.1 30S ribosomal protein S4 [Candidatus Curtissbacteria bacterium]